MEREQIIKALECCTRGRKSYEDIPCPDCPYNEYNRLDGTTERHKSKCCDWWLMVDTLALIKELTEDNERINLEYKGFEAATNQIFKTIKADYVRENERLKAEVSVKKKLLDKCVDLEDRVKANTLNDMQTRFAMHFGTYRPTDVVKVTEVFKLLKKISREMLYEEEECPSCKHFVGCECFDGETCDLYEKNTEEEEK